MQNELLKLVRPDIIKMNAYRSARSMKMAGTIWLDANENPLAETKYTRYPMPQPLDLITRMAEIYDICAENILLTRGSDEGIDLLIRLFCRSNLDKIMICPPTYGMYVVAAQIQGIDVVQVPLIKLDHDFSLDVSGILQNWRENIKLIFLCSPNNPTGNLLNLNHILKICSELKNKAFIIVDEAYIEFANAKSMTQFQKEYPNLIILRTLSKAYGLAGVRCGATIANEEIIQLLQKIIAPYPIPTPVVDVVMQQLDLKKMEKNIMIIKNEREKLITFLGNCRAVKKVFKSDANFILFAIENVKKIMMACLEQGVVLRDRSQEYHLMNCIRISIGKPNENNLFMEVMKNA